MRYAIRVSRTTPEGPVGEVVALGDESKLPAGFLWCQGQVVSKVVYPQLWQTIGDIHTPLGFFPPEGTFCLPDMREGPRYERRKRKDHRNAATREIWSELEHLEQMLDGFSMDLLGPMNMGFAFRLMALKILEMQDRIEELEKAQSVR